MKKKFNASSRKIISSFFPKNEALRIQVLITILYYNELINLSCSQLNVGTSTCIIHAKIFYILIPK